MSKPSLYLSLMLLLLINASYIYGQDKKYNTKIEKAGTVNIYGKGNVYIGKIYITATPKSKILLKATTTNKNENGEFVTQVVFTNVGFSPSLKVDINLQFDQAVDSIQWDMQGGGVMFMLINGYQDDKRGAFFKADEIKSDCEITAKIISKKKLFINIYGVQDKSN